MSIIALQKSFTDSSDNSYDFHKISQVSIMPLSPTTTVYVDLEGFKNQAAYDAGKSRVESRRFAFTGTDYDDILNGPDVIQDCYAKIETASANPGPQGGVLEDWTTGVTQITSP